MTEAAEGTLLWEPFEEFTENTNISRYIRWLKEEKNLSPSTVARSSGNGS